MCFFILKKNLWRWWRWRKKSHFDQQRARLTPADTNLTRIRQFCNYNSKWVMGKRNEMFDRIFLLLDNSKKLGWSILCERSWKKRKKGAVDKLKYFDPNKFKFFVTGKTFSSVKLWTFDCRYQSCDFLFFYCKKSYFWSRPIKIGPSQLDRRSQPGLIQRLEGGARITILLCTWANGGK